MSHALHRRRFLAHAAGSCALAALATPNAASAQTSKTSYILCSTTQTADFARQIVGDRIQVRCVLAPGEDPHLYRLKPRDASLAAKSAICIQNGWHLEGKEWMATLAKNARKTLVTCIKGIKPLELHEDDEVVHDPHAWFSPRNAAVYVRNIFTAVARLFPAWSEEFAARAQLYLDHLRVLDRWIRQQVAGLPTNRRVLVTSHDAFNYFCSEYGFRATAPAGWSTGEELGAGATPQRRRDVVTSIRKIGVPAIFVETSVNPELIQEIARDAGVSIGGKLYSDSMGEAGAAGETYLGMMRENVLTIVNALRPLTFRKAASLSHALIGRGQCFIDTPRLNLMRPVLAGALSLLILGSVQGFMLFQQHVTEQYEPFSSGAELDVVESRHRVRVVLGFNATPDPFQLFPAALTIEREGMGEPIARHAFPILEEEPVEISVRAGSLRTGTNALTVTAWPAFDDIAASSEAAPSETSQAQPREILLTWLQDDVEIATQRLQATGGQEYVVAKCELELP